MKKTSKLFTTGLLSIALALFSLSAQAQETEYGLFDHLGVGISAGTDGLGFDLAAPITDWVAVRAGMSITSFIKYKKNDVKIDSKSSTIKDKVDVEGKLNTNDFKVLFDFYPAKSSSFHLTAGAFLGSKKAVKIYTTEPLVSDPKDYGTAGIVLGDHRFTSGKDGKVEANVEVAGFRPYVGFGFGRAIPKKSRVSLSCDFGVKIWGKPEVWAWERTPGTTVNDPDWMRYTKLEKSDIDNDRGEDAYDIIEKISVYPVISIRLSGRIF